jgi:ferredoxin
LVAIYVITEPCIGVKDGACVDVCPVACSHTTPDDPQYYIDPDICIECEQCEIVCPVDAIFTVETVPDEWQRFVEVNAEFFRSNKPPLAPVSIAEAEELAAAVHLFAAGRAVAVAVAIVDPDGGVLLQSAPTASLPSEVTDTALTRARKAASIRLRTDGARVLLDGPTIVGAIGVAGADRDIEAECCEAGMIALRRAPT